MHVYGAHIFHTSNPMIWNYINQFATFNRFTNMPVANHQGEIYNLPFNMNTFNKLWGVVTPLEAQAKIEEQRALLKGKKPSNLEEQAISLVGTDIYHRLIKAYTEKQWGRSCRELPAFIIKRLPVRFTYDNNYFNDTYQGIPIGGYTQIIEKMLDHENITVHLNTDFFDHKDQLESEMDRVVYTGMIDQYFNYELGHLEYRSLRFEHTLLDIPNYQGNAVVNYTDADHPFTRIIEHKHFEFGEQQKIVITKEYPVAWQPGDEPYYPINDQKNNELFRKYYQKAKSLERVTFGGRLGMYRYYDMHMVIHEALLCSRHLLEKTR